MMGDTFVKKAFPALSIVFCPPFPDCLMTYPVVSCCFCYSDFITFFNYPLTKIVDSVNFYRYIHIILLLSDKKRDCLRNPSGNVNKSAVEIYPKFLKLL